MGAAFCGERRAGAEFEAAWPRRVEVRQESLTLPVISREDLTRNKRATGRKQDALDADRLDKLSD